MSTLATSERMIARVVKRLRNDYRPKQVFLFGSYARGSPRRDSDVDLLIVKKTAKPFYRRLFEVRRLVSPLLKGRPFDPIVMTPREVQQRLAKGDQFIRAIVTKGKLVYGVRH